jgi:hypothetical protein
MSWADERFGCKRNRLPKISTRHGVRRHEVDYREDLSRFPGDPEAYVSGERDVAKLIDKRKREGWRIGESTFADIANDKGPAAKTGEQIAKEAYEAAAARNFEPEAT